MIRKIPLVLFLSYFFPSVFADDINPQVFSIKEKPYGSSLGEWTDKWWNWYVSFPDSASPSSAIGDQIDYCKTGQIDKNVWFLTGAQGGNHERVCNIPAGKAIFIAHGIECSEFENEEFAVNKLYDECAFDEIKKGYIKTLNVELDGVPLKNISNYGIGSKSFDLYFPVDDVFNAPKNGTAKAAHFTYSFLFKPLSQGEHKLHIYTASDPLYHDAFSWDVTYILKVQ
jgi:hypothetical protein